VQSLHTGPLSFKLIIFFYYLKLAGRSRSIAFSLIKNKIVAQLIAENRAKTDTNRA
jgi:hypothetical protein